MSLDRAAIGLWMILSAGFGGCSSDDTALDGDGSADASGPQQSGGTCDGYIIECYKFDDTSSCALHDGCGWDQVVDDCNGKQTSCENIFERDACVRQLGCSWTYPDGRTVNQARHVSCTGDAVECSAYPDNDACEDQWGCDWDDFEQRCTGNTNPRLCSSFSTEGGIGPSTRGYHPQIAIDLCRAIEGCQGQLFNDVGDPVEPENAFDDHPAQP